MHGILVDVRQAVRSLRKRPVFVTVVALTLALGVGANSSVFAILYRVVLRPLPYSEPDRLVVVRTVEGTADEGLSGIAVADFLDLASRNRSFDGIAAMVRPHLDRQPVLRAGPEPERVRAGRVTPGFFGVLGVQPRLGRAFIPEDTGQASTPAVILSHGAWVRRFGGDPGVLERTLRIDEGPHRVVGVLPSDFEFQLGVEEREFWIANRWLPGQTDSRNNYILDAIARLAPGANLESGQGDVDRIAAALGDEHPETNAARSFELIPLHEDMVGHVVPALRLLGLAATLVLLVACVNVSVLLLARGDARRDELMLRRALGASSGRVTRLLLIESLVLAMLGLVPGTLLGLLAADGLVALSPARIPRLGSVEANLPVLAFGFVVCLAAGALAGLLPALKARRARADALVGTRALIGRRDGPVNPESLLVGLEAAMILVLLSAVFMASRSLTRLLSVDPGFDPVGRVALTVDLPEERYSDRAGLRAFFDRARTRLADLPGVREAGMVSNLPLNPASWWGHLYIRGRQIGAPNRPPQVDWEVASPGYFKAIGIPPVAGRVFGSEDGPEGQPVAVINETMAGRYWPDADPIGAMIGNGPQGPWRRVVGVVGDVKQQGLGSATRPHMYIPLGQTFPWTEGQLVIWLDGEGRASREGAVAPAVKRALRELEPGIVVGSPRPLRDLVAGSTSRTRFYAALFGLFGAIALALGLAGIYGVVDHWLGRRTREIGLRAALGAGPGTVLAMVMRQGLVPVAIGGAAGLGLAFLAGRFLESLFYGVTAGDPVGLTAVGLLLAGGAALASFLPARRALRLDPATVLRE